ncbi:MAG: hypothetical protein SGJ18_04970 [Pseudomonadota bacterium]|nr:hypothetical protein [Pseudomonadota bacterium]
MIYLRLFLLTVIIASMGCLEAKKKAVDYGQENSAQDVSQALSVPLKDYSPFTMQKGDLVEWNSYYFIKNSSEQQFFLGKYANEVINRTETNDKLDFRIQLSVTKPDKDGKIVTSVGQSDYTVVKPIVSPASLLSLLNINLFDETQPAAANRVTFHRLQVEQRHVELPETVKDKSVCSRWENCKIPATFVHYETVEWKSEGPERSEWEYYLTPHLPFVSMLHSEAEDLPANLQTCLTKQVGVEGKKYIVTFCTSLTDFAFGKTE